MESTMREWRPRHGKFVVISIWTILAITSALVMAFVIAAFAADVVPAPPPATLESLMVVLIPAIWTSVGPLAIAAITKAVNQSVGTYVPRSLQVVLSSILGALAASMADGGVTVVATAMSGGASQIYAAMKPESLLTSPKEPA